MRNATTPINPTRTPHLVGRCGKKVKMNYHNISHCDLINGMGCRVVIWVSGCRQKCDKCFNPETHPFESGVPFDDKAEQELFEALSKPYIAGITFSGGHPLEPENLSEINRLIDRVRKEMPNKNIWLYTGFTFEQIMRMPEALKVVDKVDVLCDGRFVEALKDENVHWVGSTNQRVLTKADREALKNATT